MRKPTSITVPILDFNALHTSYCILPNVLNPICSRVIMLYDGIFPYVQIAFLNSSENKPKNYQKEQVFTSVVVCARHRRWTLYSSTHFISHTNANWRESQIETITINKMLNVYYKNQWVFGVWSGRSVITILNTNYVHWIFCLFNFIHSQFIVCVSVLHFLFIYYYYRVCFCYDDEAHTSVGCRVKNIKRVDSSVWMRYFSPERNNS